MRTRSSPSRSQGFSIELPTFGAVDTPTLCKSISSQAYTDPRNSFSDPAILRGVSLTSLMNNWRLLFRNPPNDSQFIQDEHQAGVLYRTSQEVTSLNWFISHSWKARSCMKYVAMLWVLNRRHALRCAILLGGIWSVMSKVFPLPRLSCPLAFLDQCLPHLSLFAMVDSGIDRINFGFSSFVFAFVFVFVLFFNPHRSNKTRSNIFFFLDRACIHQNNPELKEAGIRSIGAFLKKSQRMLVLWSPDYFSRLWCNYEIATFASLHGAESIDFVPLYLPIAGLSTLVVLMLGFLSVLIAVSSWGAAWHFIVIVIAVITPSSGLFVSRAVRKQSRLHLQIEAFKLADSKCYCCDVDHKLPDGKTIPCDRTFVQDNVKHWFSDLDGSWTLRNGRRLDGVELFEHFVQEVIGKQVRYLIGPFGIPLSNFAYILFIKWYIFLDLFLLNPEVGQEFQKFILFHALLETLLPVSDVCLVLAVTSRLLHAGRFARDGIADDVLLGGLAMGYSIFFEASVLILLDICYLNGAKQVLFLVTGILCASWWLNYKLAWQQGSLFTAMLCHVSVPISLGTYCLLYQA